MSDFLLDQYEEYLIDFRAWGHEFFDEELSFDEYEALSVELEDIEVQQECDLITNRQRKRRDEIARLILTHESYFVNGPRLTVVIPKS